MRDDYLITIFSRRQGKTRTITLSRSLISWAVAAVLLVVILSMVLAYAFVEATQERRELEGQVTRLEQSVRTLEGQVQELVGRSQAENTVPAVSGHGAPSASMGSSPAAGEPTHTAGEREISEALKVKIEDVKATLVEDGIGFRLEFRLSNLADAPASGAVAVVASRTSPGEPRFVPSPLMEVDADGTPLNVRKSARFSIRNFRYMNGRFTFPYAQAESFRILVYSNSWRLVSDTVIPAAEVEAGGTVSAASS